MTASFARLEVRRYRPKRQRDYRGHSVVETLHLRLRTRVDGDRRTLGTLTPVSLVQTPESDEPIVLSEDRARAWAELAQWICYYVIYPDASVQDGQYRNRLKWQQWAHQGAKQPSSEELYDWRHDTDALERLRPSYRATVDRLIAALGRPSRCDAAARHPNPFEDEGLSDDARRLIRDLKAVFGPDILRD